MLISIKASYSDGSHHTYFKGTQLQFRDIDLGLTLVGFHADLNDIIDGRQHLQQPGHDEFC